MSPWLYSMFINGLLKKLKHEKLGVVFVGEWAGALAFADDFVMVAESEDELDRMIQVCEEYARKWRFEFNVKKCKVMIIEGGVMEKSFKIEGKDVERVNFFKYLGVWLSEEGRWEAMEVNGEEREEQVGAAEGDVGGRKR